MRLKFIDTLITDPAKWRADMLTLVLRVAVLMGALVYGPSVFLALKAHLVPLAIIDTFALATVIALLAFKHLPFAFRGRVVLLRLLPAGRWPADGGRPHQPDLPVRLLHPRHAAAGLTRRIGGIAAQLHHVVRRRRIGLRVDGDEQSGPHARHGRLGSHDAQLHAGEFHDHGWHRNGARRG